MLAMPSFAGAIILPDLKKTVLFKNRDMIANDHRDELFYDVDCFGIRGIDNVTGKIEGIAIGVNRFGLAIANTHVKDTSDPSYHVLTEQLLMFSKDAEDGLTMTVDQLKKGRNYQWGNLILADNDSMLAIELAGNDHSIEWSERRVLRTGHHIMLDTERSLIEENTGYDNSVRRVERGYQLIREIKTMDQIFSLLKDHNGNPGQASLCRHPEGSNECKTIMSYVIEVDYSQDSGRPKIVFHYAKGTPCQSVYNAIPIVFPADEETIKRANQIYHNM